MSGVLFFCTTIDEDVVEICRAEQVAIFSQGVIDESLEGSRGTKTKNLRACVDRAKAPFLPL